MAVRNGSAERERPFLFDPDDPEYIKDLQRPAVIKEDLTEMERRRRVQQILDSKDFCKELEEVIRQESECARKDPAHLSLVQKLSELTLPTGAMNFANIHAIGGSAIPVADLRSSEKYTIQEKVLRNKLASLYRLVDVFQWSQGIYNHISLRLPGEKEEILINPFGLLYHEISASSLVKASLDGTIIDAGTTNLGINQTGFVLHSALHRNRSDATCVLHLHTAVVSAVASMRCGLLPLCQEAMAIGPIAYHDYQGILTEEDEKNAIVENLGDKKVMLLRSHGFVVCGSTIEETLQLAHNTIIACETQILICRGNGYWVVGDTLEHTAYLVNNLIAACDHQVRAAKAGLDNLILPTEETIQRAYRTAKNKGDTIVRSPLKDGKDFAWKVGELEWEAWMRVLDHAGFKTGHIYRQPNLRPHSALLASTHYNNNEVAQPPSNTATGMVDESDQESYAAHRVHLLRKENEKYRWINGSNNYQKIAVLETNTDHPKVITKWVNDPSTTAGNGTPVKINGAHHFSPMSANAKEFKNKQKEIKENRRLGQTTAGPKSQILDAGGFDESQIVRPDIEGNVGPSERSVLIGTASKGIIDRQHQHNAQVYRQLYAPNPFAVDTDDDIKKYMEEVELKCPKSRSSSQKSRSPVIVIERPTSPFDDSADAASLMQAIRAHRHSDAYRTSASMDGLDAADTNTSSSFVLSSTEDNTKSELAESQLPFYSQFIRDRPPIATSSPMNHEELPRSSVCGLDEHMVSTSELEPCSPAEEHFRRTKSEQNRSTLRKFFFGPKTTTAVSEDEGVGKELSKRKKKGVLSFFRKKKDKN